MDEVYDFGIILQKLRKEKDFTQEQLARLIHKESSIIILNTNKIQEKICTEIQYIRDCRFDFFPNFK